MCRLVASCRSLGFLFLYLYMIIGGGEMFSLPHAVGVVIARLSFIIDILYSCVRGCFLSLVNLFFIITGYCSCSYHKLHAGPVRRYRITEVS